MLRKFKRQRTSHNRLKFFGLAVVIVLAISGITLIAFAFASQQSAPSPPKSVYGQLNTAGQLGKKPSTNILPYSKPLSLTIPAINVKANLITVGKNPDGSIEVPAQPHINNPAWYKYSPSPGEFGASVIEGHVDNYYTGASVFFNLGKLKQGDKILIKRSDGITVTFSVNAVRQYKKSSFPTAQVYEPTGNDAELHLLTCGGTFDRATGHYLSNTVVFSSLSSFQTS